MLDEMLKQEFMIYFRSYDSDSDRARIYSAISNTLDICYKVHMALIENMPYMQYLQDYPLIKDNIKHQFIQMFMSHTGEVYDLPFKKAATVNTSRKEAMG